MCPAHKVMLVKEKESSRPGVLATVTRAVWHQSDVCQRLRFPTPPDPVLDSSVHHESHFVDLLHAGVHFREHEF